MPSTRPAPRRSARNALVLALLLDSRASLGSLTNAAVRPRQRFGTAATCPTMYS